MRDNAAAGLSVLLLAGVVLLVRWLAIRGAGLARAPRRFPLLAAALFAVAGVATFMANAATPYGRYLYGALEGLFGVQGGMGLWHEFIAGGVALLTSAVGLGWYLTKARLPRFIEPAAQDWRPVKRAAYR